MSVLPNVPDELLVRDSARISRLKDRLLAAPYEICLERARHFTRVYRETEDLHPATRNALALEATCECQPVHIYADEWIVGNKTDAYLSPVIAPERGDSLRILELDLDVLSGKERPFSIKPEDRAFLLDELIPYWKGRCIRDLKAANWMESGIIEPVRGNPLRTLRQIREMARFTRSVGRRELRLMAGLEPGRKRALEAGRKRADEPGRKRGLKRALTAWRLRDEVSKNNPNTGVYCYDVQGHLHLGVEKVVREGFLGIKERAAARLEALDPGGDGYDDGRAFLEAVMTSMDAACTYADRLRSLADSEATATEDPDERERLRGIAASLEHAPARGARTFRESVQAVWFALLIGEIQYGMHDVLGIGRPDQYLLPLYRRDVDEGRLDREEALELLEELNLKLTANVSLFPDVGTEANSTLGVSQHCVVVGGQDAAGADATNELSWLMLDAYERMRGAINQLSVRVHAGSPPGFLERAVRVFRRTGGHAFFNDEVIVPALVRDGFSLEDARDYNIVGCIETSGGANCFGCPGGHEVVLPVVLYMTMTNGRLPAPIFGQKRGLATGDPDSFRTFADFMAAFGRQLEYNIGVLAKAADGKDRAYMGTLPSPYVSALIDGCIESATDMTLGGAAYDFTSAIGRGLGTCVDSLLAIREFVYERRELSLSELVAACLGDFSGREDLRRRLISLSPGYGRDDEEADRMAAEVVGLFARLAGSHTNARGGRYRAGMYSYGNHVIDGFYLGATPDGRRRGEPVSNGICPPNSLGEGEGLTAFLRSAASVGQDRLSGGVALNVRLHPSYIESDEGVRKVASLVEAYFGLGGMHIQPNVVSDEELRAAREDPDSHRGLVVKVAGYSAYFTDLGRSIQDDIIDRHQFRA